MLSDYSIQDIEVSNEDEQPKRKSIIRRFTTKVNASGRATTELQK